MFELEHKLWELLFQKAMDAYMFWVFMVGEFTFDFGMQLYYNGFKKNCELRLRACPSTPNLWDFTIVYNQIQNNV